MPRTAATRPKSPAPMSGAGTSAEPERVRLAAEARLFRHFSTPSKPTSVEQAGERVHDANVLVDEIRKDLAYAMDAMKVATAQGLAAIEDPEATAAELRSLSSALGRLEAVVRDLETYLFEALAATVCALSALEALASQRRAA